jgi:hypothetical protein
MTAATSVAGCILAMSVVGLVACSKSSTLDGSPTAPTPAQTTDPNALSQVPSCPSNPNTPLFDVIPIDPGDFLAFRPLGFMAPPIHMFPAKHSAFSMTPPGASPMPRPVRAPGRVWVKEIWEATFSTGGGNYQLFVYPCSEVRVYFGHVATITDKLMTEMRKRPSACNSFFDGRSTVTTCRYENMSIVLESGEQMGTGPDSAGVDFGLIDFRLPPAPFMRLDHYDHFYPYYASPLNYFRSDVKSALASQTGHVFGTRMRSAQPLGGAYMQDIAGTAQGNWFLPGMYHSNSTDLSTSLGLATDYVEPGQPIMAIGSSVRGLSMGLYSFGVAAQGSVNRAFSDVRTDGSTYCYDNFLQGQSIGGLPLSRPNGIVLLSLPSDASLRIELVAGAPCASAPRVFSTNATTFER